MLCHFYFFFCAETVDIEFIEVEEALEVLRTVQLLIQLLHIEFYLTQEDFSVFLLHFL